MPHPALARASNTNANRLHVTGHPTTCTLSPSTSLLVPLRQMASPTCCLWLAHIPIGHGKSFQPAFSHQCAVSLLLPSPCWKRHLASPLLVRHRDSGFFLLIQTTAQPMKLPMSPRLASFASLSSPASSFPHFYLHAPEAWHDPRRPAYQTPKSSPSPQRAQHKAI
ncbi:hypothetical protein M440DRAFT_191297 [Trichoderma longibrachiatum ATCC 18648]|uniref:Uncharacterized protein n=1 Tax=Trichoderma longibrachiatum ATCC 18648 TaxID=983965 RepID=A0A2T4CFJ4_TRILO|nr:hypothetical protein M440DRAFT_191297 [Trichoderma longibrachiatum ATCC 18648]